MVSSEAPHNPTQENTILRVSRARVSVIPLLPRLASHLFRLALSNAAIIEAHQALYPLSVPSRV
ncbi:hypothetical protein E2C01_033384 [Portunus trituberculatus]|uniref:Uncharacterized protein n=1 Tax=Portunus trituberculatus TaxID=210409 RepID=A0A5B7F2A7_PORTR|nr:hypothetical protein [Portunus trituberculatus]